MTPSRYTVLGVLLLSLSVWLFDFSGFPLVPSCSAQTSSSPSAGSAAPEADDHAPRREVYARVELGEVSRILLSARIEGEKEPVSVRDTFPLPDLKLGDTACSLARVSPLRRSTQDGALILEQGFVVDCPKTSGRLTLDCGTLLRAEQFDRCLVEVQSDGNLQMAVLSELQPQIIFTPPREPVAGQLGRLVRAGFFGLALDWRTVVTLLLLISAWGQASIVSSKEAGSPGTRWSEVVEMCFLWLAPVALLISLSSFELAMTGKLLSAFVPTALLIWVAGSTLVRRVVQPTALLYLSGLLMGFVLSGSLQDQGLSPNIRILGVAAYVGGVSVALAAAFLVGIGWLRLLRRRAHLLHLTRRIVAAGAFTGAVISLFS